MARSYIKKSEYWNKNKKPEAALQAPVEPKLVGGSYFDDISKASRTSSSSSSTKSRMPANGTDSNIRRYAILSQGLLPFDFSKDGVDVRDAILLCQKAYANVAIVRNTIDIATEFANTDIYLEGGTERSREFFKGVQI